MTRCFASLAAALALVAAVTDRVWAGAPTDQVREYTDAVLKILEDPALKTEDRKPERRAAVRKIATEVFDVQETARRALRLFSSERTVVPGGSGSSNRRRAAPSPPTKRVGQPTISIGAVLTARCGAVVPTLGGTRPGSAGALRALRRTVCG